MVGGGQIPWDWRALQYVAMGDAIAALPLATAD